MDDASDNHNPDSDTWQVATADTEAGPIFIRLNNSAKPFAGKQSLNIKLAFAIPLSPNPAGDLSNSEELETLATIEDHICQTVRDKACGIHVLTLTDARMRELVFYIQEGADIAGIHKFLMDSVESHAIQCMAVREPNWETYFEFSAR